MPATVANITEISSPDLSDDLDKLSDSFEAPSPKHFPTGQAEQDSEPAVAEYIADVAKRSSLTESEKYNFYHYYTPDGDFKFPREKSKSFWHGYLKRYKWLAYSRKQNGGYCIPCVLFARGSYAQKGKGAFVETAFVNFKKAYEVCSAHAERKYHCDAVIACNAFIEIMSGRQESVAIQLERGLRNTVKSSREKLHSIIETLVFCGRQKIFFVAINTAVWMWKVYSQKAQTMAIFGTCLIFVYWQEILCLQLTLQLQIRMPCTHLQTYKIRSLEFLVTLSMRQF